MLLLKTQLQTLASSKPHEVKQAVQALEAAPPNEATAALLDLCEHEEQEKRKIHLFKLRVYCVTLTAYLAVCIYAFCSKNFHIFSWLLPFSGLLSFGPSIPPAFLFTSINARKRKYLDILMKSDDPRVLVPMLDTFSVMKTESWELFQRELARRLWNLAPDDALAEYLKKQRTQRKYFRWLWVGGLLLLGCLGYFILGTSGIFLYAVIGLVNTYVRTFLQYPTDSESAAADALCQHDDLYLVAPLLDAHRDHRSRNNKSVHPIEDKLKNLLTQLQSGDGYLLSPRQRSYLRYIVNRSKHRLQTDGFPPELTAAALNALCVIGDTKAVKEARMVLEIHKDAGIREAATRLIAEHDARRKTDKARVGTMTP